MKTTLIARSLSSLCLIALAAGCSTPVDNDASTDGAVADSMTTDIRTTPTDVPNRVNDVPNADVPNADVPNIDVVENDVVENDVVANDVPNAVEDAVEDVANTDTPNAIDVADNDVPNAVDVQRQDVANDGPVVVPPAYTVAPMLMADCDDLARGEVQLDIVDDDAASAAPIALPFAFRLYGTPVSHWSGTTNGYAQLYADGRGTPSTSFSNVSIPGARVPSGMLAAFWDDLVVVDPAVVRTLTLGVGAERRFVIEWFNVDLIDGGTTLQFQIKLYETSNVIEYHYCTLNGDGSDGASATVGLQSVDPAVGDLVGFNAPGTLIQGQRIRFTPR